MTEIADDPEAQSTSAALKLKPHWVVTVCVIVTGLGVIAIVWSVFGADHLQHLLAFLGAVTAVVASCLQGKTAKTKSKHHQNSWGTETEAKLKSEHKFDANHFKKVSAWWYTFLVGAIAAALAELIDWGVSPSLTGCRSCFRSLCYAVVARRGAASGSARRGVASRVRNTARAMAPFSQQIPVHRS
jgi:hypothetical protein